MIERNTRQYLLSHGKPTALKAITARLRCISLIVGLSARLTQHSQMHALHSYEFRVCNLNVQEIREEQRIREGIELCEFGIS